MKTLFALVFCISVILLVYLSSAVKKEKPEFLALEPITLYDRIDCMADCPDYKVLGVIPKGETFTVLSSLKGKTKTVLRVETPATAGWTTHDLSVMQKMDALKIETIDPVAE